MDDRYSIEVRVYDLQLSVHTAAQVYGRIVDVTDLVELQAWLKAIGEDIAAEIVANTPIVVNRITHGDMPHENS